MNHKSIFFVFLLFWIGVTFSSAQTEIVIPIVKTTEIYAVKQNDTLRLDLYRPAIKVDKTPCIIFMFGGGFTHGVRDKSSYIPYFNHLVQNGYSVISIDYRLGLKKAAVQMKQQAIAAKQQGKNPKKPGKKDFLYIFAGTIDMAVEDLFSATNYLLTNADKWNIDKDNIITCGSSAGAISVLHGEYNISNETDLAKVLPANFNYAGVISFAGAIFSLDGGLKWKNRPAPIQFFHGNADKNVPYDELRVKVVGIPLKYGFYGSKHIAKQLGKMNSPYYFYSVDNTDHIIADSPMTDNWDEIDTFLQKFVKQKKQLIINTEVQPLDKPNVNKKFGISDYLKANGL